jgi:hypothetical protein
LGRGPIVEIDQGPAAAAALQNGKIVANAHGLVLTASVLRADHRVKGLSC